MPGEKKQIDSEVEEQFEYLFAETEEEAGGSEGEKPEPLRELKAIFLAVDWEINDEIMSAMLAQIEALKEVFKGDQILMLFMQLLGVVAKYVKAQKANAHPDAIKLLHSIHTSLEIVSMSEGMTEAERKKILRTEVSRFQQLKTKIGGKAEAEKPIPPKPAQTAEAEQGPEALPAAMKVVLDELRKTIRAEFEALRAELKS